MRPKKLILKFARAGFLHGFSGVCAHYKQKGSNVMGDERMHQNERDGERERNSGPGFDAVLTSAPH